MQGGVRRARALHALRRSRKSGTRRRSQSPELDELTPLSAHSLTDLAARREQLLFLGFAPSAGETHFGRVVGFASSAGEVEGVVDLTRLPQVMQQNRQATRHGHHRAFLPVPCAALCQREPAASEVAVRTPGAQNILRRSHEERS